MHINLDFSHFLDSFAVDDCDGMMAALPVEPPLRLDVSSADIVFGLRACYFSREHDRGRVQGKLERIWGGPGPEVDGNQDKSTARAAGVGPNGGGDSGADNEDDCGDNNDDNDDHDDEEKGGDSDALCALSVRTAFDAYLSTLLLPAGSEVLMSAVTIPDMVKIVIGHGLVPVAIDLDSDTLCPNLGFMEKAVQASRRLVASNDDNSTQHNVRLLVVSHVFGSIASNFSDIVAWAHAHDILVAEDCAEAFSGLSTYRGLDAADASFFSFGTIKTCTALGGALMRVKCPVVRGKMRVVMAHYPLQPLSVFAARLAKIGAFRGILASSAAYGAFVASITAMKGNSAHTEFILSNSRGFTGQELFSAIRQQPPVAVLQLLLRRIKGFDERTVTQRVQQCTRAAAGIRALGLPLEVVWVPGRSAAPHYYWLFPICVRRPQATADAMLKKGFDAMCATTSLICAEAAIEDPSAVHCQVFDSKRLFGAAEMMHNILYLPVNASTSDETVDRMVRSLGEVLKKLEKKVASL